MLAEGGRRGQTPPPCSLPLSPLNRSPAFPPLWRSPLLESSPPPQDTHGCFPPPSPDSHQLPAPPGGAYPEWPLTRSEPPDATGTEPPFGGWGWRAACVCASDSLVAPNPPAPVRFAWYCGKIKFIREGFFFVPPQKFGRNLSFLYTPFLYKKVFLALFLALLAFLYFWRILILSFSPAQTTPSLAAPMI